MAFSLNRAQVIGNVTRDPEVRQTGGGQMVASFSVATNSSWMDKAGQRQEKAEFHNIVLWGKLAEIAQQYVKKGRKIFVEGRMQTHDWEGEDGVKRMRMEIIGENIILLDRSGTPTGEGEAYEPASSAKSDESAGGDVAQKTATAEPEVTLDDLPF
ncbi:MAG: single-stranded DNA-binding protein [Candidatus Gracilibacteria bacterium]